MKWSARDSLIRHRPAPVGSLFVCIVPGCGKDHTWFPPRPTATPDRKGTAKFLRDAKHISSEGMIGGIVRPTPLSVAEERWDP